MRSASRATPSDPISSRFARIEDVAADWLARREAGLTVNEQAKFSRWLLADPRHASTVKRIESTWRVLRKPRFTGQAGEVVQAIEARVEQRARRSRRRALLDQFGGMPEQRAARWRLLFPR